MADTSAGWVKLFREFTQWEWYRNANVKIVYLHLILMANHTDKAWQGITIKRGQFVTSFRALSEAVALDVHTVQRALKKLQSTGEITVESNAKFSIITLNNYEAYQGKATPKQRCRSADSNARATLEQSTKEYKNIRRKEETPAACSADAGGEGSACNTAETADAAWEEDYFA